MDASIPKDFKEVAENEFELSVKNLDYRRDHWANVSFYVERQTGWKFGAVTTEKPPKFYLDKA